MPVESANRFEVRRVQKKSKRLLIDEETQGFTFENLTLEELTKLVISHIDENVETVEIKKLVTNSDEEKTTNNL
ncbi:MULTISPECIES: hypothetical protein [Enterococcus]|uniref:hypothetical protein n=1 Tax=Enterococcus TaxID=1350 RepID=UPI0022FD61D1|nr:hypothetical protein [Enterococcus casseliflavus]MDT2984737.1 hypothetical protein [Enterococcus casseliflavus]WBY90973.1 hypothetical protein PEZ80_09840 [Enterococcus casseliflavus]